ncbi:hypothetical protein [Bradyrhizobium sp. CCBAU 11357]|uniref:hypothetical protein n=1 Tax=Bradyrhizobium sp. CCBAU 11357 TaxID=1630808 RepID=UPI00230218CE|nr:hypothetical protein [Bradyrhizobium sp. CCBAU 11357]
MAGGLKRDAIGMNRHRALAYCLSMIFSENRFALFRIMLSREDALLPGHDGISFVMAC